MGPSKPKGEDKMTAATQPKNFVSPLGNLTVKSNWIKYAPKGYGDVAQTIGQMGDKVVGTLGNLPEKFSLNDYYNNPFYGNTLSLYKAPIERQYETDSRSLDDMLAARNQLGGSFEALMRQNLMRDRDYNLSQAESSARGASANAYMSNLQSLMDMANNLTDQRGALLQQYFMPASVAQGAQAAITPLQVARAGYYGQVDSAPRESLLQTGIKAYGQMAGSASQAAIAACWVAREVYGTYDPRWVQFRKWILTEAPDKTREYYLTHGPDIAERLKEMPSAKAKMRQAMDTILLTAS